MCASPPCSESTSWWSCANKMDLVGWDRSAYQRIADEMDALSRRLGITVVHCHPDLGPRGRQRGGAVRRGAVVRRADGARRPRVRPGRRVGSPALPQRHGTQPGAERRLGSAPGCPCSGCCANPRAGATTPAWSTVARSGRATPWSCSPRGRPPRSERSRRRTGPCRVRRSGLSVSVRLADDLDVSRGDLIASAQGAPEVTDTFEATVCWFQDSPLSVGDRLRLKHTTRVTPVVVEAISGTFDVNDLKVSEASQLQKTRSGSSRCGRPRRWPSTRTRRIASQGASCSSTSARSRRSPPAWSGLPGSMTERLERPHVYPVSLDVSGAPLPRRGRRARGGTKGARPRGVRRRGDRGRGLVGEEMESLEASLATIERRPYEPGDARGTGSSSRRRATTRSTATCTKTPSPRRLGQQRRRSRRTPPSSSPLCTATAP